MAETMFIPVHLRYTNNHLWLRDVGRHDAYAGITDYAQRELGRIDSIEIEHEGSLKKEGETFGIIYGANKCVELIMPFAGRILIVNPEIEKHTEVLNSDPYHYWTVLLTAKANLVDNMAKYFTSEGYQSAIRSSKNRYSK